MLSVRTGGVLALDIAPTITGWAYGPLDVRLPACSGRWAMPAIGGEGARYVGFTNALYAAIERWQPSQIFIENVLPPQAQTDAKTAYGIYAMRGFVVEACDRHSISFHGQSADTVRLAILGRCRWQKRGDDKKAVVGHCLSLGLDPSDHNEADAIMVWLWVQRTMAGVPPVRGPIYHHVEGELAPDMN